MYLSAIVLYVLAIIFQGRDPWTALPLLAKFVNLFVESRWHRALNYGERTNTFFDSNQLELPHMSHNSGSGFDVA